MPSANTIRVLIVDDIAETRENIRRLLQFERNVEIVGSVGSGREAVAIAEKSDPDVIIMDINMPDMDGITATERIRERLPYAQVVILTVQDDPNYMRRAMLAGARDFLAKPPTIDELVAAVQRAGQFAHAERQRIGAVSQAATQAASGTPGIQGKIVTLYAPKGGLGCTTLAVNLAVALHSQDTPTVVVDSKIQYGDVALFFNEHSKFTLADLLPRADALDAEVVDNVLTTHEASGVKILAAPARLEERGDFTGDQLGKLLTFLRQLFAYVVVDTASPLEEMTLAAIDASDLVITLVGQDIPSIKNARLFLNWMRAMEVPEEHILMVMNRYDKRVAITPERVGNSFRHPVALSIPEDYRHVLPAVNKGRPVIQADRGAPISRQIIKLAERVRRRLNELETATAAV